MALADAKPFAVAHWTLDEASGTRADGVGSNDLTDNNTVGSATGMFGNAADFERDNFEYLSVADNADLSVGDEDFTVRAWVYLESANGYRGIASKWHASASSREYRLFAFDSGSGYRFHFAVSGNGTAETTVVANSFGNLSTGVWYLVHAWHDSSGNAIGISVNAGTANTAAHSTGIYSGTSAFYLGCIEVGTESDSNATWDGLIDDVVVLKGYVLDATERSEDYNAGTGVAFEDWDAGGGGTAYNRSFSESVAHADAYSRLLAHLRQHSDTHGLTDAFARLSAANRGLLELLGNSDTFARIANGLRDVDDNLGASDAFTRLAPASRAAQESLGSSDAYSRLADALRRPVESLGSSDSFSRLADAVRIYTDAAGLADAFARTLSGILTRMFSESLGSSDAFSRQSDALRILTDTSGLFDAFLRISDALRDFEDAAGLQTPGFTLREIRERSLPAELLGLIDVPDLEWIEAAAKVIAVVELLGHIDAFARRSDGLRAYSETVGISDAYARLSNALRSFQDFLASADTFSRTANALRLLAESAGLLDATRRAVTSYRHFEDVLGLADLADVVIGVLVSAAIVTAPIVIMRDLTTAPTVIMRDLSTADTVPAGDFTTAAVVYMRGGT